MNVLFANYGDFATNSTSHIAGFANALAAAGHACVVAVPWGADTVRLVPKAHFRAVAFGDCLQQPLIFPNGGPADIVHAWTPREIVREFILRYCAKTRARLVVHLEDNEDYLFSAATGLPVDDLLGVDEDTIRNRLTEALAHPRRARLLLRACDGITTIVPTLRAFAPAHVPTLDLPPGVDFALFRPTARLEHQRSALGFRNGEKCIVYTGSTSYANAAETRDLYHAVALLNERGVPTLLIRTGVDHPAFTESIPTDVAQYVRHLGFIPRTELPQLLAQADVLVQPGRPGAFNNFRLPSKLPEYLAAGRPVILPASNIGLELAHDREAIVLDEATPEKIADACTRVFHDAELAARLVEHGSRFARKHFDGALQARRLADFYQDVLEKAPRPGSASTLRQGESEISLALRCLGSGCPHETAPEAARDLLRLAAPLVGHLDHPQGNRRDLARLEHERDTWRDHFEDAREHAANVEQRNDELIQDLDQLKLAHAIEIDQLRHALAVRDEKITRMQASFSWQVTAPLRALRRILRPRRHTRNGAGDDGNPPPAAARGDEPRPGGGETPP